MTLTGDGIVRNGPGLFYGMQRVSGGSGTWRIYNGFSTAGALIFSVTNPNIGELVGPPVPVQCDNIFVDAPTNTDVASYKVD